MTSRPGRHPWRRLLIVGLFIGLLFAVFELSGLRGHLSLDYLHRQIEANRLLGLLLFVLLFSLGNLIQVPGWIFLAAAVLALGKLWGGVATYVAASLSCICTFLLIRLLGGDALRELDQPLAVRILARLDRQPVRAVALLRILFQTLPALNYALALSGVRFRNYLAGTMIGLPVPIAIYCLVFDSLAHYLLPAGYLAG
jgi:uncharacterized membrane protein YdjX (TVP38/TMEM64 family)